MIDTVAQSSDTHDHILILDFGSQVTQLIARRVRESGVYCEIWPFNHADEARIQAYAPKGSILSGGPKSVTEAGAPAAPDCVFEIGVPVFGICYGQQTMVKQLGGSVEGGHAGEFGRAHVDVVEDSKVLAGSWAKGSREQVWMSHGDRVTALPDGFTVLATSEGAPYAFVADLDRRFYGVQFHPEVVHTPDGAELLRNFTHNVCGCTGDWTMASFKDEEIARIRAKVGDKKVICGLSGGVDSSVTAVLLHEAIGDQLTCIYVDTGLMRHGESEQVVSLFREHYNIPLIHEDASDLFLGELEGVSDPETKRKTIGKLFIDVFDNCKARVGDAQFLAQGTLYPGVIESVSFVDGEHVTIKSHHNVGGLPEDMELQLVEPLRELFKDEVRDLGRALGMPEDFIRRHPFRGGSRFVCRGRSRAISSIFSVKPIKCTWEIRNAGLYDVIWQAFAVCCPCAPSA